MSILSAAASRAFAAFAGGLLTAAASAASAQSLTSKEAQTIAEDAYVYGYPLVTMELTRRSFTNVAQPDGKSAPMGYFVNVPKYPLASDKRVTAPTADTLYSTAWIDVGDEPYIPHVPDEHDRYYLMPMLDGWTNVFADPGKRTTGTGPLISPSPARVGKMWPSTPTERRHLA